MIARVIIWLLLMTYHIDYAAANDSANGTSTSTPWKRHPYMVGWSGSYSHAAGDIFIFKGGVTWPRVCFQMHVVAGGSAEGNRDVYTADETWFTGGSFVQPKFDFEHNVIPGGYSASAGVFVDSGNYITFDNIDLANHRQPLDDDTGPVGQGASVITLWGNVNYVTVQNCTIRDWDVALPVVAPQLDGGSSGAFFWYYTGGAGGVGNKAVNNLITQEGVACRSGRAFKGIFEIIGNEVRYTHTVLIGAGDIHDNHFHHLEAASDPDAHTNTLYIVAPCSVYNNVIHDIWSGNQVIYCEPGFSAPSGNLLVYNNVVYDGDASGSSNGCLVIDPEGANAENTGVKVFNNSFQHNGPCIRIAARPGKKTGLVELANNHYITPGAAVNQEADSVITFTDHGTDITQTSAVAATYGASAGNNYQPTSAAAPTVGGGYDLSGVFTTDILGVTRAVPFDIGAYEYAAPTGALFHLFK